MPTPKSQNRITSYNVGYTKLLRAHYVKYAEPGELFINGGPDAPENFLAYEDFDNTPNYVGANGVANRKTWAPHAADYHAGDPSWQGGKGTEIIGALNYLASEGLNAFSFLTIVITSYSIHYTKLYEGCPQQDNPCFHDYLLNGHSTISRWVSNLLVLLTCMN